MGRRKDPKTKLRERIRKERKQAELDMQWYERWARMKIMKMYYITLNGKPDFGTGDLPMWKNPSDALEYFGGDKPHKKDWWKGTFWRTSSGDEHTIREATVCLK